MFIYTMKGSTLRFFSIVAVALIVLVCLIVFIPEASPTTAAIAEANASIRYDKIKTNSDRVAFLEQFGWNVSPECTEEVTLYIPNDFDTVMSAYNELQKQQGLDLSRYKGKEVTRYTYKITNFPDYEGTVYANVIVWKNKVVGGDICSADASGFIYSLSGK